MLGKITNFINNYIKKVVAEQNEQQQKETKPKIHRDFGADISSMELKKENIKELVNLSLQKTVKDFVQLSTAAGQIAMDSSASIKDFATPAVDMSSTTKDIVYTFFSKFGFIGWQNCAILAQHWLISNACSLPAKDAIRNGWQNIFADKDKKEESPEEKEKEQKFLTELNEITNTKFHLSAKAIQWVTKYNIYGIGIALPIIDGVDLEKPYNPDGIKKGSFKGISIIDPYWLTPEFDEEAMTDPSSTDFYKPTYYRTADGKKIHASHLIIIRRKEVPDILKPSYYFGGIPLTQEIFERVYAAEKSANEQPLLLLTKRLNGWKIDLEQFFTNPDKYAKRIKNFTEYRDNQGIILVDHEDDMFQIDTSLSDLDQVVMSQYKLVAAVARIPVDKLFELNPSGTLSNSGDFNIKNYNQDLNTMQNDQFKPLIDRINEIVMRSYYDRKDKIAIIFNPTDNPTAKEKADSIKSEVDTLQGLIANNIITNDEARQKLISNKDNGYSFLDEEAPEPEEDNQEIEQMMKEAAQGKKEQPQKENKAEDTDFNESKVNRDEKGRFATKNNIQAEIEIDSKEFNEKLSKAQTTKITKKYKDYREVEKNLRALANKNIKNNDTGSVAQINNAQRDKLVSNRAVEKSNNNGFSREEHLSAAAEIKQLYEKAIFKGKRKDEDNNDMFIKRFVAPVDFGDKKAYAKITAKETIVDGERIYSIELHSLEQIDKKEAFDSWE